MKLMSIVTVLFMSAFAQAEVRSSDLMGTWQECINHEPGYSYLIKISFTENRFKTFTGILESNDCSGKILDSEEGSGGYTLGGALSADPTQTEINITTDAEAGWVGYGVIRVQNDEVSISEMADAAEDRPTLLDDSLTLKKVK